MDDDATIVTEAGDASGPATWTALTRGDQIGRYLIVDELGHGAMGVVYAAYDPRLDRKVAIKLLRLAPDELERLEAAHARLLREAQALAKLSHPNVVAVHDVEIAAGRVFVAMEMVEGRSLREWMQEGKRSWHEVLPVFRQAAKGLAAAHRAGVVHRDFKPDNVLLADDGRVLVADFGLASATGEAAPSESVVRTLSLHGALEQSPGAAQLTRTGRVVGTPAYMAPEQHAGETTGPATDQFAFCVSLWEALYGARPFLGTTVAELARAVFKEEPAKLEGAPDVPSVVHRAMLRGLAVDPGARHESMEELAELLAFDPGRKRRRLVVAAALVGAVGLGVGVSALGTAAPDRCEETSAASLAWTDEAKAAVEARFAESDAVGADAAATAVGEALDGWVEEWSTTRRESCERFFVRGEDSDAAFDRRRTCLDERLAEFEALVEVLSEPASDVVGRAPIAIRELAPASACLDDSSLGAAVAPPSSPEEAAQVEALRPRIARAHALVLAARYEEAAGVVDELASSGEVPDHAPTRARIELVGGEVAYWGGRLSVANARFSEAAKQAARGGDARTEARAWMWRTWTVGYAMGRHESGLTLADAAESAVLRAGDDEGLRADLLDYRGMILVELERFDEADPALRRALELREKVHGRLDHRVIWSLNNIAVLDLARGDVEEAIAMQERALPLRVQMYGPDHTDVGFGHLNLGDAYAKSADLDQAHAHYTRARTIFEAGFGPEHLQTASALFGLARIALARGRRGEARDLAAKALTGRERGLGADHEQVAEIREFLAELDPAPEGP